MTDSASLFHTHVIVDWSARSDRSPVQPSKNAIWWAVAHTDSAAGVKAPEYARTRHDALCRIARLVGDELDAGRRVLVGFDFPFGYPAGVAERVTGQACALALWDWLAERIEDGPDNTNNRFEVAAEMNARYPGLGPFWGRPKTWPYPTIPEKGTDRTHGDNHPSERRIADYHAKGAKTVWQLDYRGSVGSQVLLGLPALTRLLADPMLRGRGAVWPFDTGLKVSDAPLVVAEVYPSLLKRKVDLRRHDDEILDRAQVRVNAEAFTRLDADGGLAPLFAGARSLTLAERHAVETEEAWILGLGHEEVLECATKRNERRPPQRRAGQPLECLTRSGVILCTERYEECVDFYRRTLGLPEIFSLDNEHSTLTCLDMGGSYLMIETGGIAVPGGKPIEQSPVTLRFNVRDVEVAAAELETRGVHVAIRREPWGTVGDFIDPDGNRCALRDEGSFFPSAC